MIWAAKVLERGMEAWRASFWGERSSGEDLFKLEIRSDARQMRGDAVEWDLWRGYGSCGASVWFVLSAAHIRVVFRLAADPGY
jgi:hypothetical protein